MMIMGSLFASDQAGVPGLVAICCYLTGLGMSFGPIIWILMSELFPAPIRAQGVSIAIAAQWAANFIVSASFPVMFGDATLNAMTHGGFAFYVYGAFAMLAGFVVLRHVPETKGLDQDLIGAFWRRQAGVKAVAG
jgi:SP family xylose:H+ symportor-like MFS transporter